MKHRVTVSLLSLAALLPVGTAQAKPLAKGTPKQVKADFAMICNATARAGATNENNPSAKARKVATYMLAHIETRQTMSLMQDMASLKPEDRSSALKKAAAKAGYRGACPFADAR